MTPNEFIEKFKTAINAGPDVQVTLETNLDSINEWDSLGMACTISMFAEEFHVNMDYTTMESFKTVSDLMTAAGVK